LAEGCATVSLLRSSELDLLASSLTAFVGRSTGIGSGASAGMANEKSAQETRNG
jgi:hypothetical protein